MSHESTPHKFMQAIHFISIQKIWSFGTPHSLFLSHAQQQQHQAKLLKIVTHHMQETYKFFNHSSTEHSHEVTEARNLITQFQKSFTSLAKITNFQQPKFSSKIPPNQLTCNRTKGQTHFCNWSASTAINTSLTSESNHQHNNFTISQIQVLELKWSKFQNFGLVFVGVYGRFW
jgi:hypothetical protein